MDMSLGTWIDHLCQQNIDDMKSCFNNMGPFEIGHCAAVLTITKPILKNDYTCIYVVNQKQTYWSVFKPQ